MTAFPALLKASFRVGIRDFEERGVCVDAAGRLLRATIPIDADLKLWIFSRIYHITDDKGIPLESRGSSLPFRVASGSPPSTMTIAITGKQ